VLGDGGAQVLQGLGAPCICGAGWGLPEGRPGESGRVDLFHTPQPKMVLTSYLISLGAMDNIFNGLISCEFFRPEIFPVQ
jgi:hypothetical protein